VARSRNRGFWRVPRPLSFRRSGVGHLPNAAGFERNRVVARARCLDLPNPRHCARATCRVARLHRSRPGGVSLARRRICSFGGVAGRNRREDQAFAARRCGIFPNMQASARGGTCRRCDGGGFCAAPNRLLSELRDRLRVPQGRSFGCIEADPSGRLRCDRSNRQFSGAAKRRKLYLLWRAKASGSIICRASSILRSLEAKSLRRSR
jgi:hypothetical protein